MESQSACLVSKAVLADLCGPERSHTRTMGPGRRWCNCSTKPTKSGPSTLRGWNWKYRFSRRRRGETVNAPMAERRSRRSQALWTGVRPCGDHVRRRVGSSIKPVSSSRMIQAPFWRAPFLCEATPRSAIAPVPARCLPVPAVRAFGRSNRGSAAGTRRGRDDNAPRISARSPGRPEDTSIGRWRSRPWSAHREESPSGGASAGRSSEVSGPDEAWSSTPPILLSRRPLSSGRRKKEPPPRPEPPPEPSCPVETSEPPKAGGLLFVRPLT